MEIQDFQNRVRRAASKESSADSEGWTEENPLWGHCAVVALLAQDCFGGSLVKGSLENQPKYAYLGSHFWNHLLDGTDVDFTSEQYSDLSFRDLVGVPQIRERVMGYPETEARYLILKERFAHDKQV